MIRKARCLRQTLFDRPKGWKAVGEQHNANQVALRVREPTASWLQAQCISNDATDELRSCQDQMTSHAISHWDLTSSTHTPRPLQAATPHHVSILCTHTSCASACISNAVTQSSQLARALVLSMLRPFCLDCALQCILVKGARASLKQLLAWIHCLLGGPAHDGSLIAQQHTIVARLTSTPGIDPSNCKPVLAAYSHMGAICYHHLISPC